MGMQVSEFDYELPDELIAKEPVSPRDHARLLVVDRESGEMEHRRFDDLPEYVGREDLLVLNDSKVIPARLFADGGRVEIVLIEETSPRNWVAIGKPGKKLRAGARLFLDDREGNRSDVEVEVLRTLADGTRVIRFYADVNLEEYGQLPLPPYIQKARSLSGEGVYQEADPDEYQTVYADEAGSVAAPTAGLHFTPELLERFDHAFVTLHVGLGTFRPVKVHDVRDHEMHVERYSIPKGLDEKAGKARRVVAVGTTSARVLESRPKLQAGNGRTGIFIHPPYQFKRVDVLVTNFHLPGSTLIMLVAAFMGHELQRKVYEEAVRERYRFYSYGDAMLVL